MSRSLHPDVQTAIDASVYRPVFFVRLSFEEGVERACTAPFSIWFDDTGSGSPNEFTGVGVLGGVSAIEEGSELQNYGASVSLSGVDTAQLAYALDATYQGREAVIWLGFLNSNHELIGTPVEVRSGLMDTMPIEVGKEATINLTIEDYLTRWENPNPWNQRYTDADHQDTYPGDKFFEFASAAVAREIIWGRR